MPSPATPRTLLRARTILPMTGEPLENGAILLAGPDVQSVGKWPELRAESVENTCDLGEVILLPGLLNAHCHLDYTDMAGQIPPQRSFSDWVKGMLALKAQWSYSDYAASWLKGARALLAHGVTSVADIEAVPELLPDVLTATPLRVCSLLELTGIRKRRSPEEVLQGALEAVQRLPSSHCWAGLSPHAPYSTNPDLLRIAAAAAREHHWPLAIHVAESAEEFDMYQSARGPLFEWLQVQRDMSDCGSVTPVACLHAQGALGRNTLCIHANYLGDGDAELLARTESSVVHCPRSHEYFGHQRFPLDRLVKAGVNICLGTDSMATVQLQDGAYGQLSLFPELQLFARRNPTCPPDAILQMVTRNAAQALAKAGKLGELSPGAAADFIVLPSTASSAQACDAVIHHTGPVPGVMLGGQWIERPHVGL